MDAEHLIIGGRGPEMELNPQGQADILGGLINVPGAHVFLQVDNPKYRGALAEIVAGQDFSKDRVQVRLVIEGKTILVKHSAIVLGATRSRIVSEAIITIFSVHMLHVNVGQKVERRKIILGDETIDALGISIYKFDELVATMAGMFVALLERFGSAKEKKMMDDLVACVKAHQKEHGRMMAELFILYKTISKENRAKVNKNALEIAGLTHGKMVEEEIFNDKKAKVENALEEWSP